MSTHHIVRVVVLPPSAAPGWGQTREVLHTARPVFAAHPLECFRVGRVFRKENCLENWILINLGKMIILRFLLDSSSAQIHHSRCCRCHNNSLLHPEKISLRGCSLTNTWDVHNMWLLPQSATSAETSRSDLPGIFSNVRFSWYFSNARFSWFIQQCQISWYFSNVKKCFELIDKPGKGTMRAWAVFAMVNKKRTRQVDSMSACVELMRGTVDSIVLWNAIRLSLSRQTKQLLPQQTAMWVV